MIDECLVVEFRVTGDRCPLAEATRETGTAVEMNTPQFRRDENALLHFSADTGDADLLAEVLDRDDRVRYLHTSTVDGRVNFRCLSKHPCIVHTLADAGFMVQSLRYNRGAETYTGAVVGYDVLDGVLEAAGEAIGVTLKRIYPLGDEDDEAVAQRWGFTPAQETALRVAAEMGYFSYPRDASAQEVADELGISKSAFLERLRRGQDTLMRQLF